MEHDPRAEAYEEEIDWLQQLQSEVSGYIVDYEKIGIEIKHYYSGVKHCTNKHWDRICCFVKYKICCSRI